MSNCVYQAYIDHLSYLGLEPTPALEWYIYQGVRVAARVEPKAYTPGSIVALIYQMMAAARGLELTIQSRRGTKEFYLQCLEDNLQRKIVALSDFGEEVDVVTLVPAIHLLMNRSHAHFQTDRMVPYHKEVVIEMAFQFRRKEQ